MRVIWLGYVSVGSTPRTPVAYAPSATNARRFGTLSPCRAASKTASGLMPSMEINMTNGLAGLGSEVPVAANAGDAATRAPISNRVRRLKIGFKLPRSIREPAPAQQSSSDRTIVRATYHPGPTRHPGSAHIPGGRVVVISLVLCHRG